MKSFQASPLTKAVAAHRGDGWTGGLARNSASVGGRQRGVTLVVSLIFLLLLTIIGVTALSTNSLQEKMAGNMRDKDAAFQAAESALRAGEEALFQIWAANGYRYPACSQTGTGGVWDHLSTNVTNDTWWNTNSIAVSGISGVYAAPKYVIECLQQTKAGGTAPGPTAGGAGPGSTIYYYRITARGFGLTPLAQAMQQTTYALTQ